MHTRFLSRKYLASLLGLLLVLAGGTLATSVADALEISRFDANRVNDLSPGTELVFRLEGTPQATATVTVSGIRQPITLNETSSGYYEGRYTIRTNDRLSNNPDSRATLRQGSRTTTAALAEPLMTTAQGLDSRQGQGSDRRSAQGSGRRSEIQRFTMEPNRIEPGRELVFTLEGTPNGTATVNIRNAARDIPMTEIQSGVYEGRYTVRQRDGFSANDVTAKLEANGQVERTQLAAQMGTRPAQAGSSRQANVPLEVTAPQNMAHVPKGPIEVKGHGAPNVPQNVRVDASSALGGMVGMNQNVFASTVNTDENGNFVFSFEPPTITMPGTRYEVNISGNWAGQDKSKQLTLVQR
jgi:hypothetical protein